MIYFQLRNVPGSNGFHFGYFCLTKMCICTRETVVLNALTYLSKFEAYLLWPDFYEERGTNDKQVCFSRLTGGPLEDILTTETVE